MILTIWHLGLCWPLWDIASWGCQFLELVKELSVNTPFICKPSNPEPTLSAFSPAGFHTWVLFLCLITLGPGRDNLAPGSLKLFKLGDFKPACSASPLPSCGYHNKASYFSFPLAPSASWPCFSVSFPTLPLAQCIPPPSTPSPTPVLESESVTY